MSDAETRRTRRRRRSDQGIVAQPAAVARPSILFVDDDEALARAFARPFLREVF